MRIKELISDLLVVAAWMCAWAAAGATNTAASLSYSDVSNAVHQAVSGDTVLLPAGTATWTNGLVVGKELNLIGAGDDRTFITNYANGHIQLFTFALTNGVRFRVSGIFFDGLWDQGGGAIAVTTRGYQDGWKGFNYVSGFRVDNCTFYRTWFTGGYGAAPIELFGRVWGVIDHCRFVDGVYAVRVYGNPVSETQADAYGWPDDTSGTADWDHFTANPYYYLGSTNNVVLEDNWIGTQNPSYSPGPGGARLAVSSAWTAHYVFRYNVVSNTFSSGFNDILDLHGNKAVDGTYRGGICAEVYANTVYATAEAYRFGYFRGGTCLVFSNAVYGPVAAGSYQTDEEECWNGVGLQNTNWPGMDCVTNSFFWANTVYGTNYSYPQQVNELTAVAPNYFQEGRDFWKRAPQAGDALAAYVPLTYPHPLVAGTSGGGGTNGTNGTNGPHGIVSGRGVWSGRGIF